MWLRVKSGRAVCKSCHFHWIANRGLSWRDYVNVSVVGLGLLGVRFLSYPILAIEKGSADLIMSCVVSPALVFWCCILVCNQFVYLGAGALDNVHNLF